MSREFIATTYKGRPAVMDVRARVFYQCATRRRARDLAAELNRPAPREGASS